MCTHSHSQLVIREADAGNDLRIGRSLPEAKVACLLKVFVGVPFGFVQTDPATAGPAISVTTAAADSRSRIAQIVRPVLFRLGYSLPLTGRYVKSAAVRCIPPPALQWTATRPGGQSPETARHVAANAPTRRDEWIEAIPERIPCATR